jgi:hypothetical protein
VNGKVVLGTLALLVACSSRPEDEGSGSPKKTSEPEPPPILIVPGSSSRSGDAGCVAQVQRAEALPLDIYVLFDQSGSMSTPSGAGSRLDAVRAATSDFLNAKESAGIGVGLGYFGYFPIGQTSCNPSDYARPAVEIGALPAQTGSLLASLRSVAPTGETPTGPAIRGACSHVESWDGDHPGRSAKLLLLTDGVPEAPVSRAQGCDPTLADAIAATKECVARTGTSVYVLGVGPNLANLNQIAAAGGSGTAFLVDGGDVAAKVFDALNSIRSTALPCGFVIPEPPAGEILNFGEVNVVRTDADRSRHPLYNVPDSTACDSAEGGWFYESAGTTPERITLCEASCQSVKAASVGGAIEFALGCGTVTVTR